MQEALLINVGKMIASVGKLKWFKDIFKDPYSEEDKSIPELEEYISRGVNRHDFDD